MKQKHQERHIDHGLDSYQGLRILDLHKVKAKTSCGKTTLYKLISQKKFPRPISLVDGGKKVGWVEAEIDAYLQSRIAARDGGAK